MMISIDDFDIRLTNLQKWQQGKWRLEKAFACCISDVRENKCRELDTPLKKAAAEARIIELQILRAEIIKEYMKEHGYAIDESSEIQEYNKLEV